MEIRYSILCGILYGAVVYGMEPTTPTCRSSFFIVRITPEYISNCVQEVEGELSPASDAAFVTKLTDLKENNFTQFKEVASTICGPKKSESLSSLYDAAMQRSDNSEKDFVSNGLITLHKLYTQSLKEGDAIQRQHREQLEKKNYRITTYLAICACTFAAREIWRACMY
jgi:hypothetical protein